MIRPSSFVASLWGGFVLALVSASVSWQAFGQELVIGPGRETEVLALFAPYELGNEVAPGWTLDRVQIDPTEITVSLQSASDSETTSFVLRHRARGEVLTPSFAIADVDREAAAEAHRALLAAVRQNDDGRFWERASLVPNVDSSGSHSGRLIRSTRSRPHRAVWLALFALITIGASVVGVRRRSSLAGGPPRSGEGGA